MADSETLKLIKKALRLFPKVVREKERAAKERERDIKRFAKLSRQLAKIQAKKEQSQTLVREHARHVPVSTEHPDGLTHVHEHLRSVNKKQMSLVELCKISESYDLNGIKFPTSNRLEYKRADEFDRLIAIWMDFFNKLFAPHEPMDPDILKALIGSESSFDPDPKTNNIAMGLTQVTKETLKILVNSRGEAKAFTFKGIKQSDLKDPNIAVALAARWLHRKKETAQAKLGRPPSVEEIILEYKGILNSKSKWKTNALNKFKRDYAILKK